MASPDGKPVVDVCTNNDDSSSVSDDLQIVDGSQFADALPNHQGFHLRDRSTIEHPDCYGFPSVVDVIVEPSNYQEASGIHEWQLGMQEKLDALDRTGTWDLVPLQSHAVPITCKWVFKIKTKSNGSVERYKVCLVVKGFQQTLGVDYDETFASVAQMTTVRTLIVVAASCSWTISQMDVKNAFLHGDLHEEVYMHPPLGGDIPFGHVCRLRKALYASKQAPRAWFHRFVVVIRATGFTPSDHDPALFLYSSS